MQWRRLLYLEIFILPKAMLILLSSLTSLMKRKAMEESMFRVSLLSSDLIRVLSMAKFSLDVSDSFQGLC